MSLVIGEEENEYTNSNFYNSFNNNTNDAEVIYMAGWNGNGVFSKTYSWVQDQINGIKIRADRHDQNDIDFVNGINNCLTKDGQNTPSANLPMANFRHTGVANAVARTDYLAMGQFQDNSGKYYTTTGSSNAYVLTASPVITTYTEGLSFYIKANHSNTAGATLNVNGLGTRAITKEGTTALASGDLVANNVYEVVYDGIRFQVVNFNLPLSLSATYKFNTLQAIGSGGLVFKTNSGSDSFFYGVGGSTAVEFYGDIKLNSNILDANGNIIFTITENANAVNNISVANSATTGSPSLTSVGSDTNIDFNIQPKGTGQVILKGLTFPASDGTAGQSLTTDGSGNLSFSTIVNFVKSSEITVLTGNQTYTFAHGLGVAPDDISAYLVCKTADLGYAVGDVVKITDIAESTSGSYIYSNATNVVYLQNNGIGINNHTGGRSFIDYADWKLILTATLYNT